MFTKSNHRKPVRFESKTVPRRLRRHRSTSAAQELVRGWNQESCSKCTVMKIGAGGASPAGMILAKQGIGRLIVIDPDVIEASNLNRQLYRVEDIFKIKGPALAKNLACWGALGTVVEGYPLYFSEFIEQYPDVVPDVGIVGVDNDKAREETCRWFHTKGKSLICLAVSEDTDSGYVFVQEPTKACLGCFLGYDHLVKTEHKRDCPNTPAVMDVLQVACAWAAYAVGSIIMDRPRSWNLLRFSMSTGFATGKIVERSDKCPICSHARNPLPPENA